MGMSVITKEEASGKWCPLTYQLDKIARPDGGEMVIVEAHGCVASVCMWWVWAGSINEEKTGYCGAVK